MSINSISLSTKQGKLLVSRCFNKSSILTTQDQIHQFPKQIKSSTQHTFIYSLNTILLYIPIQTLYLVMIVSKSANIIEMQKILQNINKKLQDLQISETSVQSQAFEIMIIFDMMVNDGYQESISLQEIDEYLKMESSEEILQKLLKIAKENEAKEMAKKFIREKQKNPENTQKIQIPIYEINKPIVEFKQEFKYDSKFQQKTGLQLGKKVNQTTIKKNEAQIEKFDETKQEIVYNPLNIPIEIQIKEYISCLLTREGDLQSFEIQGEVNLKCFDPKKLNLSVQLSPPRTDLQIKPNPNLNKQNWNSNYIITPKQGLFPLNQSIPALKYKFSLVKQTQLPFAFTYWFNGVSLTIELESQSESLIQLEELQLLIPIQGKVEVQNIENSDYKQQQNYIQWDLPKINKDQQYSIEICFVQQIDVQDLFPIQVNFQNNKLFSNISVKNVLNNDDNSQVSYQQNIQVQSQEFKII